MKAVQIARYGGPEQLALVELPLPEPGAGEVRVQLRYSGVNFIDIYTREGRYRRSRTYGAELPFTLGMEGAGRVDAVGPEVDGIAVGDRVAYCLVRGSYAEHQCVPAARVTRLPDDVPFDVGATLMLQGCTAHYLTRSAFALAAGHTCLVHAGAGGVGRLLIQLAHRSGARVLTTVGSPAKADIARRLGADVTIAYREVDFRAAVMEATNGVGVDVVYDAVGKDTIAQSLRCLKRRGTCVNYGGSSGFVESLSPLDLAEAGSVFFTRPHLAHYLADSDEIRWRTTELFDAYRSGLAVHVDRVYALAETADAHEAIEGRRTTGKLLLQCGEGAETGTGRS